MCIRDRVMSIFSVEDWPYFQRFREAAKFRYGSNPKLLEIIEDVRQTIRDKGPVTSDDLEYKQSVASVSYTHLDVYKRQIVCDLLSLSPKLMHSGNVDVKLFDPDIIKYYLKNYNYQIKFVVRDQQNNFDEITHLLSLLDTYDLERILIMPMSATKSDLYKIQKKIISLCLKNGYRYSNRLQLQVWGNKKEV